MSDLPPPAVRRRRAFLRHWGLLALALALLGAQMAWNQLENRAHIGAEAQSRLENHGRVLADSLERQLGKIDEALRFMLAHGPAEVTTRRGGIHFSEELIALQRALQGVRVLFILDAQGTMVASSRPELIGRNFAQRDYFQTVRDRPQPGQLHVSPPFTSVLNAFTIGLSRPLLDAHGAFAGAAVATIDVAEIHELLASLHPLPGTRLSVVYGDGTLLTLFPAQPGATPGRNIDQPGFHFRMHKDSGRPASLLKGKSLLFGKEVVVAVRTIRPAALGMDAPLVAIAGRDLDDILAPWRADVRHHVAFFLLLAAGSALALGIYQRRRLDFERRIEAQETETRHALLTLQRFIDHLPGLAYVKDAGLRLRMANRGFSTLLGMEPAAIIGKTHEELMPGPFGEKISAHDRAVLADGKTATIEETYNGRDYETTKFIIEDGRRQIGGITFDITARKEIERALAAQMDELRELNRQLEEAHGQLLQSEKMASIGQLAAGVAHELNNPIGFVHSNLGTLEGYLRDIFQIADACTAIEDGAEPACPQLQHIRALRQEKDYDFLRSDVMHLLDESKDGLARVAKIVRDLKDFSRPGDAAMQWADLHAGLDSTLNIVWNELKYKCEVKKEYGELPLVWCEPSQLNQVFMNLLTNAGHAIADKGTITIRTGVEGGEVWIAVSDTGSGIAPEHLARIFDPYFTTKPVGKGTGLGLSLSYGIVRKHGGRIEVASEPGQGATFTVRLPIGPAEEPEAATAENPAASPAPSFGASP